MLNQRYTIQRTLVSGSDSHTYEAHDHLQQRSVLLKEFVPGALQDWKRFQLIEREAKILAQFNHIEIPSFVDFFTVGEGTEQKLYLVSKWIHGETLAEKIESGWRPALEELYVMADMALRLLIYIHAFNPPIVHRDIKPSNLMLSQYNRLFLLDFGGVQEAMESQGAGGSTLVGTLGYMAPEQLMGRAEPASDLYALGLTFMVCLTGLAPEALPFVDERISFSDCEDRLGRPLELSLATQRWLGSLCTRELQRRYSSARDALEDLDILRFGAVQQRDIYLPENHKANVPEIIHSLTLIERAEEDTHLLPGSLLQGRFEIGELLGSGTHSRVYAATQRQKPVIIKELLLEDVENWKNIELFEREIEIMRRLKHPRIPRFIDAFQIQEGRALSWYLVTEALDAQPLDQALAQGWRPGDDLVWQIAEQLLEILLYLHEQEPVLVHRDIKPSNILKSVDHQIYVIDFGAVQNRLWATGGGGSTIIGTFGYMAPETFGGQATAASDLYSLGATLVNILSGKHPIEIPLEASGLNFAPFVRCSEFHLCWLQKLVCVNPQERFQSAQEALSLLRDAAQGGKAAEAWLADQRSVQKQGAKAVGASARRLVPKQVKLSDFDKYLAGTSVDVSIVDGKVIFKLPLSPVLKTSLQAARKRRQGHNLKSFAFALLGTAGAIFCSSQGHFYLDSPVLFLPITIVLIVMFALFAYRFYALGRDYLSHLPLPILSNKNTEREPRQYLLNDAHLGLSQEKISLSTQAPRSSWTPAAQATEQIYHIVKPWFHFSGVRLNWLAQQQADWGELTPLQKDWRIGELQLKLKRRYYVEVSVGESRITIEDYRLYFALPSEEAEIFGALIRNYIAQIQPQLIPSE